jgi:hypothetical protein
MKPPVMKYQDVDFASIANVEAAIMRNDPAELLYVPIAVSLHSPDLGWAQGICICLASHPNSGVRGNAILGFGHLARRFGQLERQTIEPLILAALSDPTDYVRGQALDAADDIETYLGWKSKKGFRVE